MKQGERLVLISRIRAQKISRNTKQKEKVLLSIEELVIDIEERE